MFDRKQSAKAFGMRLESARKPFAGRKPADTLNPNTAGITAHTAHVDVKHDSTIEEIAVSDAPMAVVV